MNIRWKTKKKLIYKSKDLFLTRRSERRYAERGDVKIDTIDIRNLIKQSLNLQLIKQRYDSLVNVYGNDFSNQDFQKKLKKFLVDQGYSSDDNGYIKFLSDFGSTSPIFSIVSKITKTNVSSNIILNLFALYTNKYTNKYLAFVFDRNSFSDQSPSVPGAALGFGSVFLYSKVQNNLYVFSHELGHNLGLRHPFEEFGIPEANTYNYMDYNPNANMFWYWQWKVIQEAEFPK